MRKIGVIGGMSFEATSVYYRRINEAVRDRLGGLNAAQMVVDSVNFHDIVVLQKSGQWEAAGICLAGAARNLAAAGAQCVVLAAVTMHLVADAVEAATDLPFIHILDETAARLQQAGCTRPLLIATRYSMEHGFYQERMRRHGIDVSVPDAAERAMVHDIIFDELSVGKIVPASRDALLRLIDRAKAGGADAVIFGCTEICLLLDADQLPLPGFDSTAIHIDAAVRFALG